MINPRTVFSKLWLPIVLALSLALIAACGSAEEPTATTAPAAYGGAGGHCRLLAATASPRSPTASAGGHCGSPLRRLPRQPAGKPQPTAVPPTSTPMPAPTRAAPAEHVSRQGVMNYGVKETGVFEGHPRFMSSPRVQYSAVSFGESMVAIQQDLSPGPLLASEWDISPDGRFWTFKVRDDVEFHNKCGASGTESCGNLTIHDVLWNYKEWHEGSLNARAGIIGDFWVGKAGGSQTVDR